MASCVPRWRATPQRPARRYEIYTTMFRTCDAPPTSLPISCSADLWVLTLATFVLGAVRMVTFVASAAGYRYRITNGFAVAAPVLIHTLLVCKYSRMASMPFSRPRPECL